MKRSFIVATLILLVITAVAAYALFSMRKGAQTPVTPSDSKAVEQSATEAAELQTFTSEEVAKHNSKDDCWLILDGKVYDVTKFIPAHPGGKAILEGCGKDATMLFETRPMGSESSHSARARAIRETYYIGDLKQ